MDANDRLPDHYFIRKAGFGEHYWVEGCCGFTVTAWHSNPDDAVDEAIQRILKTVNFKNANGIGAPNWFYGNQEYGWAEKNRGN